MDFGKLFSRFEDRRKAKRKVALMSPAGNEKMLREFISIIKKQTFKDFDILFISPKGANFYWDEELSIMNAEERYPLGTSGCFFAGQTFLYTEGYEVIVVADLDAIPSSESMLESLINEARASGKACMPISTPAESAVPEKMFNVNQYGTYPREVFEKVGFANPFFWRGAEDWDLMQRLSSKGLIKVVEGVHVTHPTSGFTPYHKLANRKKFYPYLTNIMKAFLFGMKRDWRNSFNYLLWYIFYRFFSVLFADNALRDAVSRSSRFEIPSAPQGEPAVIVEKVRSSGQFGRSLLSKLATNVRMLFEMILLGKTEVYTDRITVAPSFRSRLLPNAILALILVPLYFAECAAAIAEWGKEMKKVPYPVYPEGIGNAIETYALYMQNGRL